MDERKFLGKQVRVKLGVDEHGVKYITGKLLAICTDGEFVVEVNEPYEIWYCWPLLEIEEVSDAGNSSGG